jgi:hypothetical protein
MTFNFPGLQNSYAQKYSFAIANMHMHLQKLKHRRFRYGVLYKFESN